MGAAAMAYVLWTRHPASQPGRSRLARPRPLHPLGRPRVDAPLRAAPPDRLRPVARRHPPLPPVGEPYAGTSRVRAHARGRDHHRATRAGLANAVGMAIAEAHLAARFNRPGHAVVDHTTYVLGSDGDLMEGVAAEAASLAGHLGLGKLMCLCDDNRISSTAPPTGVHRGRRPALPRLRLAHAGGRRQRPEAVDGDRAARAEPPGPSLISARTHIGYGAPTARTRSRRTASRSARRRWPDQAAARLADTDSFPPPTRPSTTCGAPVSPGRRRTRHGSGASTPSHRHTRRSRRPASRDRRDCPRAGTPTSRRGG